MPPEKMAQRAQAEGLGGIVLTEHGQMWKDEELTQFRAAFPDLIILRGIEVRTSFGDDFLVYGIEDPTLFYQEMETKLLLERVEALGGAVVLAHPFRYSRKVPPEIFQQPLTAIEGMSFHVRRYMKEKIYNLQQELDLPCFASSDAHELEAVGIYGLDFFDPITSEEDLVRNLRAKRFRPFATQRLVEGFNLELHRQLPVIKKMIAEGRTDDEIYREYPRFNYGMLWALRAGGKVELLNQVEVLP